MRSTKTFYLIFVIIISLSGSLSAQVSGYMGKRLILKFDTYSNIYFPIQNTKDYPINNIPIRKNYGVEYIIGRNSTLGFSYRNDKTQFRYDDFFGDGNDFGELINNGFTISFSNYQNNQGIAPVGKYAQFRFSYFKSKYSIRIHDNNFDLGMNSQVKITGETQNYILGLVIGNSGVLFDRILYGYGFQLGYRLGSIINFFDDPSTQKLDVEQKVNRRNSYNEFWGIHAGIGILL